MKTINTTAAQGDILIRRTGGLPDSAKPVVALNGKHVLSHDAGHPHVVSAEYADAFADPAYPLRLYMVVTADSVIEHQRSHDTHEPFVIGAGVWEIRRQRESAPEGMRAVVD
jgi:hypothetical protein